MGIPSSQHGVLQQKRTEYKIQLLLLQNPPKKKPLLTRQKKNHSHGDGTSSQVCTSMLSTESFSSFRRILCFLVCSCQGWTSVEYTNMCFFFCTAVTVFLGSDCFIFTFISISCYTLDNDDIMSLMRFLHAETEQKLLFSFKQPQNILAILHPIVWFFQTFLLETCFVTIKYRCFATKSHMFPSPLNYRPATEEDIYIGMANKMI